LLRVEVLFLTRKSSEGQGPLLSCPSRRNSGWTVPRHCRYGHFFAVPSMPRSSLPFPELGRFPAAFAGIRRNTSGARCRSLDSCGSSGLFERQFLKLCKFGLSHFFFSMVAISLMERKPADLTPPTVRHLEDLPHFEPRPVDFRH